MSPQLPNPKSRGDSSNLNPNYGIEEFMAMQVIRTLQNNPKISIFPLENERREGKDRKDDPNGDRKD